MNNTCWGQTEGSELSSTILICWNRQADMGVDAVLLWGSGKLSPFPWVVLPWVGLLSSTPPVGAVQNQVDVSSQRLLCFLGTEIGIRYNSGSQPCFQIPAKLLLGPPFVCPLLPQNAPCGTFATSWASASHLCHLDTCSESAILTYTGTAGSARAIISTRIKAAAVLRQGREPFPLPWS